MLRSCTYFVTLLFTFATLASADEPRETPPTLENFEYSTLVEWAQNLGQLCAQKTCTASDAALITQEALQSELEKRFEKETGQSFSTISSAQWNSLLQQETDANRCRLLRTAFVLSFFNQIHSPNPASWRLFTDERTLEVLSGKGHFPASGGSPLCPDYYYPESDIAELAKERGRRFFSVVPPSRE